jgi:hypothetical protein
MSLDMSPKSLIYYEARVAFGVMALAPALLIPAFGAMMAIQNPNASPPLAILARVFEMGLPLAAGLSAAPLMTIEREEGFAELRASTAESSWRVPVVRGVGALWLLTFAVLVGLASFVVLFDLADFPTVVVPALPPALYFVGLALVVSNLTQSNWVTGALLLGYWFFEYQTRGAVTQTLFLFGGTFPLSGISYDLNRGLLIGIGMALLVINGVLSVRRRGRGAFV